MSFEQTTPLPLKEFSPKNFPKMAKIGKIWVLTIFKDSKLWTLADVDTEQCVRHFVNTKPSLYV